MFEFHKDRKRYFDIQLQNAREYVIPFIEEGFSIHPGMRVLEIGCGEAGVLKAFIDRGCTGIGVEFDASRIEFAKGLLTEDFDSGKLKLIVKDIYDEDVTEHFDGLFDIIILKDVIEHIHDQEKLIGWMRKFLNPEGVVFFGFPPWHMPFGGHQQICKSKLSKIPYIHLLPREMYKWLLERNNESVEELMEIRDTRITIERFEQICLKQGYEFVNKRHYLINPIYQWKFGLKPRRQLPLIKSIPYVRNLFTTCVYYLIKKKTD